MEIMQKDGVQVSGQNEQEELKNDQPLKVQNDAPAEIDDQLPKEIQTWKDKLPALQTTFLDLLLLWIARQKAAATSEAEVFVNENQLNQSEDQKSLTGLQAKTISSTMPLLIEKVKAFETGNEDPC